jgi:hypothetical protein
VNPEDFKSLARRIHDVPRAPQGRDSIDATADDLAALCYCPREIEGRLWSEEEQAVKVMQTIRDEWDEWRGPKGILDVFCALFLPRPEQRAFREETAEPKCQLCNDTGWRVVKRGESEGAERCTHGIAELKGA